MARTTANGKDTGADIGKQIEAIRADIGALADTMAELGKAEVRNLKSSVHSKVDAAQEKGAEQAEVLKAKAHDLNASARSFAQERPGAALGIAAGAGFLIGFLSSRK